MSRTKTGRPPTIANPPNKGLNPQWWEDKTNLIRLHPSFPESLHPSVGPTRSEKWVRKKYEKKQKKQRPE
jgi:hypothetical protein